MSEISNTAGRIKELRKIVRAMRGIAERADTSAMFLRRKANDARDAARRAQAEIEAMGGKVRR